MQPNLIGILDRERAERRKNVRDPMKDLQRMLQSYAPSQYLYEEPQYQPTVPTAQPTVPTAQPTAQAIAQPTAQPTVPTAQPTAQPESPLSAHIAAMATYYGVPLPVVQSVIRAESGGDPDVVSPKGARGLMQLMPGTANDMGVDPSIPKENVKGGIKYLSHLMRTLGGNWDDDESIQRVLAAYNAGPTALANQGGIPKYPETIAYVQKVMADLRNPSHPKYKEGGEVIVTDQDSTEAFNPADITWYDRSDVFNPDDITWYAQDTTKGFEEGGLVEYDPVEEAALPSKTSIIERRPEQKPAIYIGGDPTYKTIADLADQYALVDTLAYGAPDVPPKAVYGAPSLQTDAPTLAKLVRKYLQEVTPDINEEEEPGGAGVRSGRDFSVPFPDGAVNLMHTTTPSRGQRPSDDLSDDQGLRKTINTTDLSGQVNLGAVDLGLGAIRITPEDGKTIHGVTGRVGVTIDGKTFYVSGARAPDPHWDQFKVGAKIPLWGGDLSVSAGSNPRDFRVNKNAMIRYTRGF